MLYDRITHLTALTEYLDLLDVKWIDNLPKGTGSPPSNDPQIYSVACHLQLHDSSTPYPTMCDRQKKPPRRNQCSNFQNIEAQGENFVFLDTDGQEYLVTRKQLKLYLKYGHDLHSQMRTDPNNPTPLGYNLVAAVFNEEADNPYQMARVSADGLLEPVSLPEPPSTLFFGSTYDEDCEKLEKTADFKKMGTTLVNRAVRQELNIQAEREWKAKIRAQEGVGVRGDLPAGRKERRMGERFGLQDNNHRDGRKHRQRSGRSHPYQTNHAPHEVNGAKAKDVPYYHGTAIARPPSIAPPALPLSLPDFANHITTTTASSVIPQQSGQDLHSPDIDMTLAEANLILEDLDAEGEAYDDGIDEALSQQELGKQ